jgi:hypothetical protein
VILEVIISHEGIFVKQARYFSQTQDIKIHIKPQNDTQDLIRLTFLMRLTYILSTPLTNLSDHRIVPSDQPHGVLMSVAFLQAQKKKVRVTLEFNVFSDFNAKDIDFEKVFDLEPAETVESYVEDFGV